MTTHLYILKGCAPTPLANYLKALGILRLVGEQADPQARGWWEGERFCLLTTLSKEELERFFLEEYAPTPIFNPWGARSGYYPESSEKTARVALNLIESSQIGRLSEFRKIISIVREVIKEGGNKKPEKTDKSIILDRLQQRIRGSALEWLFTVIAKVGDHYSKPPPPIFGTGGNEGSGSYTTAYLSAIVETMLGERWKAQIGSALWSDSSDRDAWNGSFQFQLIKESVEGPFRQFLPEGEGSPWDLLFAFEGALIIQSGVTRRFQVDQTRSSHFLSSPYYFAPHAIGYGSCSDMDEFILNKGQKKPGRGEQWFPLWCAPSTLVEIQLLFQEGRCSSGRRITKIRSMLYVLFVV